MNNEEEILKKYEGSSACTHFADTKVSVLSGCKEIFGFWMYDESKACELAVAITSITPMIVTVYGYNHKYKTYKGGWCKRQ